MSDFCPTIDLSDPSAPSQTYPDEKQPEQPPQAPYPTQASAPYPAQAAYPPQQTGAYPQAGYPPQQTGAYPHQAGYQPAYPGQGPVLTSELNREKREREV